MLIYLCGVNGVGKTSIIDQIQETTNVTLVKGSKLLMERLGIKNEDYTALQQIPSKIKDDAFLTILSTFSSRKRCIFT